MSLLTVSGLKKRYAGVQALDGIDLELESGKISGLLGPNTAGKTTLLKTIAGLLCPDSGEIIYPGNATGLAARHTVSMLPDSMVFPAWMKVKDAFQYYEDMYTDYSASRANMVSDILGLPQEVLIKRLSKGMGERLSLALAFCRDTHLYLLDEPLGGIDPIGKGKILESILSMPLENSSILLSTHLVKDVESVFDNIFLIFEGRIIYEGNCEDIRAKENKTVEQKYLEVFSNVESN